MEAIYENINFYEQIWNINLVGEGIARGGAGILVKESTAHRMSKG